MNRVLIVLLVITLSTLSVAQEGKEKDKIEKDTPKFYSNPAEGDVNEIVAVVPGESASAKQVFNVMSKYFGKGGSKNKNAVLVVLNTNPIPRKDRKFENLDSSEMQDKDEESEEWHVCLNGTLAQIKRKYDCWNVPAHYISMYDGVLNMFHCILCRNVGPQKMTVIAPTMLDDRFDERMTQITEKVKPPEMLNVFITNKGRKAVRLAEETFQNWYADTQIMTANAESLGMEQLLNLVMKTKVVKKPRTPKMQIIKPSVEMKIRHEKTGRFVTYEVMVKTLLKNDTVFFGEKHDSSATHSLEMSLFSALYSQNNNFALSLEMFERDVQTIIDDYLNDKIKEHDVFAKARPWPNYIKDYRPMVNFAKSRGLSVIAANVPRRYAAIVARQGVEGLEALPEDERKFIAEKINTPDGDYKDRFIAVMKEMMGGRSGHTMSLDKMYAAQCVKDDTMAESIFLYMQKNKGKKVFHVDGSFHSDYKLGTVERLLLRNKDLKIGTLSAIPVKNLEGLNTDEVKGLADFVVFVIEDSQEEDF